jgi:hypothetical protein
MWGDIAPLGRLDRHEASERERRYISHASELYAPLAVRTIVVLVATTAAS